MEAQLLSSISSPVSAIGAHKGLSFAGTLLGALCWIVIATHSLNVVAADPLDNWNFRFRATPFYDITYGNNMFVAVGFAGGEEGSIYTSPDGIEWTARHMRTPPEFTMGELRRIIFTNGVFLALGWNYAAHTSYNGTDWIIGGASGLASDLAFGFRDVCYGQGQFVAIDNISDRRSNILTSVNGRNWTRRGVGSNAYLHLIGYGNGVFVALGYDFTPGDNLDVFTSTNAINWTRRQAYVDNAYAWVGGFTWAKQLFVAVVTRYNPVRNTIALTSPDGISWTMHDMGVTNQLSHVECIDGLFVATGESVLLTSSNGTNWTPRTRSNSIGRFAYGRDTLVGVVGSTNLYQTDPIIPNRVIGIALPAQLSIEGIVGQTIRIEHGDNAPSGWQTLTTFPLPTNPYSWSDPNAGTVSRRFYRVVWE